MKGPQVAHGSQGEIHSAFSTHAGYQDLISGSGSLSLSISPADQEPLEAGHWPIHLQTPTS